ncbi:pyridoxal phosphate-dependent transferase [Spinellus fusiger]|nr:pyridoxal phosphate-dependent transferase [Spinellus fusiger]
MSPASLPAPFIYNFTSDTSTEPTDELFDIMKAASRGDDMYGAEKSVISLEEKVARLLGHEAALFCATGCMTNQLGLRLLLTQPPHSVLCDVRAHVFNYECGGIAYHSQANVTPVVPTNGQYLTAADVEAGIVTDNVCGAPTRVISLENTLNGTIMPLDEMERIHAVARKHNIKLHLDGARLWNASQATGTPMEAYGRLFDTVSVCLSKGVGAPIGSILAGSKESIRRARHLRKLMGGGWRQAGMLAAAAEHCINTVVKTMPETHALASYLAQSLVALGIVLTVPCQTNMVFADLESVGLTVKELSDRLSARNLMLISSPGKHMRVVLHYQITREAVDDFISITKELIDEKKLAGFVKTIKVVEAKPMLTFTGNAYPSGTIA